MINYLEDKASFALQIKNLMDLIALQMDELLLDLEMEIPAKVTGILQYLFSNGPDSIAGIADSLGISHQLTTQRLSWLIEHHFVISEVDPSDKRRTLLRLTDRGDYEGMLLQTFLERLTNAYVDLFSELGVDLYGVTKQAIAKLSNKTLLDRVSITNKRND